MHEKYQGDMKWKIIPHKILHPVVASLAVLAVTESLQLWPLWPSISSSLQRELVDVGHVTRGLWESQTRRSLQ